MGNSPTNHDTNKFKSLQLSAVYSWVDYITSESLRRHPLLCPHPKNWGKIALVTKSQPPKLDHFFVEKTAQDPAISLPAAALIAHETFRQA